MPPVLADDHQPASPAVTSARTKLLVALAAGIVGGAAAAVAGVGRAADARPGDMVMTMGAGNVVQAGGMLLEALGKADSKQ